MSVSKYERYLLDVEYAKFCDEQVESVYKSLIEKCGLSFTLYKLVTDEEKKVTLISKTLDGLLQSYTWMNRDNLYVLRERLLFYLFDVAFARKINPMTRSLDKATDNILKLYQYLNCRDESVQMPDEHSILLDKIRKSHTDKLMRDFYESRKREIDFKVDETIHDSYIHEFDIQKHDVICLSAPCGMGKTKMLNEMLKKYPNLRILAITFRISLVDKHAVDWSGLGFDRYDDKNVVNPNKIIVHANKYKRMITQVDSLVNIYGKFDLIILDECEYTLHHEISFVKKKDQVFKALCQHLKTAKYIVAMDALLSNTTLSMLRSCDRNPYVYYYTHQQNKDKEVHIVKDRKDLVTSILMLIEQKFRIVVPTNSEKFAETLKQMLTEKYPNVNVGLYTANTVRAMKKDKKMADIIESFADYDVVIYTPVITAGSSFERARFDAVCAYFTSNSSIAEIACQQIFRVRNLSTGKIYICVSQYSRGPIKANTVKEMKDYYVDRFKDVNNAAFIDSLGLEEAAACIERDYIKIKLNVNDPYFDLFCHCAFQINRSKNHYLDTLLGCLHRQGVSFGGFTAISNKDISKEVDLFYKEMSKRLDEEELTKIQDARVYTELEFAMLIRKGNLTDEESYGVKKYKLARSFNLRLDNDYNPITVDFIKDYRKFIRGYYNLNAIAPLSTIQDDSFIDVLTHYLYNRFSTIDVNTLNGITPAQVALEDAIDERDPRKIRLRIKEAVMILIKLGFKSPFDDRYVPINLDRAWSYITANNLNITVGINTNINLVRLSKINSVKMKKLRAINDYLESTLTIRVKARYPKSSEYHIVGMSKWKFVDVNNSKHIIPADCESNFNNDSQANCLIKEIQGIIDKKKQSLVNDPSTIQSNQPANNVISDQCQTSTSNITQPNLVNNYYQYMHCLDNFDYDSDDDDNTDHNDAPDVSKSYNREELFKRHKPGVIRDNKFEPLSIDEPGMIYDDLYGEIPNI